MSRPETSRATTAENKLANMSDSELFGLPNSLKNKIKTFSQPKASSQTKASANKQHTSNLPWPNLTNSPSPLFTHLFNPDIEAPNHLAILPAFRLASHFIEVCLPIFHAMLSQPEQCATEGSSTSPGTLTDVTFPEPLVSLTREQEEFTRARLIAMSPYLNIDHGMAGETAGTTTVVTNSKGDPLKLPLPFTGYRSSINLNAKKFNDIWYASPSQQDDLLRYLWSSLRLAETYVHELAHAVCFAMFNPQHKTKTIPGHAFLGKACHSEIGFELERRLFGGCLTLDDTGHMGIPSAMSGRILLTEFPNRGVLHTYLDQESILREGVQLPWAVMCWNVKLERITDLFQDEFWAGAKGWVFEATRFPKEEGRVMLCNGRPKEISMRDAILEVVPNGFRASFVGTNLIVKRKEPEVQKEEKI